MRLRPMLSTSSARSAVPSGVGGAPSGRVASLLTALLVLLASPGPSVAQISPFSFEVRGGASIPLGSFEDTETGWDGSEGGGGSFGAAFILTIREHWGVKLGFSQHRFPCPSEGCGEEEDFVATGFELGSRVHLTSGRVVPWIEVGAVSQRVERHPVSSSPEPSRVLDRAWGLEVGGGITVVITEHFYLSPGARYTRITQPDPGFGELQVRALVVDLGLVLGF